MHEKYDWHESQIFRLLLFVVVKCQRFVRDEKNNFLEFRASEPYLTAAIIFAKNLQPTIIIIIIIICSLQVPYLVLFYFYSVINVANVSNEVLPFRPIYSFIPTLDLSLVNIAENAFIKSQT